MAPIPRGIGGLVLQRLIDSNTFRAQTPSSIFQPRKTVNAIDPLLDAYHGAAQGNKVPALRAVIQACITYIAGRGRDPTNDRLTAVYRLRDDALAESVYAHRLEILAENNVSADMTNIGQADRIGNQALSDLASLAQVNTIRELVRLNTLPRANADIIQLANLPQVNNFQSLRSLAATNRPLNEIQQLADLGGTGLGGNVLPAQPTLLELRDLSRLGTTIVQFTALMASGVVNSASELEEYARTGRIQAALNHPGMTTAENRMYWVPMNLHYNQPQGQQNRNGWKASYGSVYAISGAAGQLADAARSVTILGVLTGAGTLAGGTGAVPEFLALELERRWRYEHTGAQGVHYQGGDRGNDYRAN